MDKKLAEIRQLLDQCTPRQRESIFRELRKEFKIHPLETKLNIQAEIILEAINKDERGLTLRMMRGVIAEAAFNIEVISILSNWVSETVEGDMPYDFRIRDSVGPVTIQVKLQRSKDMKPMMANEGYKRFSKDQYVVETQKTRGGTDNKGESTRPYGRNEFDIIAVCMQPSTGEWSAFYYSLSRWLITSDDDKTKLLKFQPVAMKPNKYWTDDLETAVGWLRSNIKRKLPF